MRTLLIDNYDSFTHNLAHQITAVTGREPVVVRNDDPGWRLGRLAGFDAVVLSPGPGTPERAADFGVCREVIDRCGLPLLGVCLGHQGIAARYGATVAPAPEPVHGRTSPVLHDGTGLFAGLPSPFDAVRYHSLTVTGLPAELAALARTPDGVLMALRHRTRPQWGVQFHPESIATRHGDRLLANFVALAAAERVPRERIGTAGEWRTAGESGWAGASEADLEPGLGLMPGAGLGPEPAPEPGPQSGPPPGPDVWPRSPGDVVPPRVTRSYELMVERVGGPVDAEAAFDALFRRGPYAYWLDSSRAGGGPQRGRFSVLGDASGPLARVATADVAARTVTVRSAAGEETVAGAFLDWLDRDLRATRLTTPAPPVPPCDFALGWVGYLGYELKAQCGGRNAHRSPDPDAVMVFADRALVIDHLAGETYLLALARTPPADDPAADDPVTVADDPAADDPATVAEGPSADGAAAEGPAADGPAADIHPAPADRPVDRPADRLAAACWLRETADRLRSLAALAPPAAGPALELAGPLALRHDRARYLELIADAQRQIAAGETYEVCVTNEIVAPLAGYRPDTAWRAYRAMRRAAPAPFGALLCFGGLAVLSTSPERFLRVAADGRAESRPIKGTRPRGATPQQDAALRDELATSEKDRSENLMIVDLVRNDLGRSAVPGSVEVPGLFEVETYDTVHQLVSTVRATLRPRASAVDCVRAAFPPGSMTGAPKIRTLSVLDRLEAGPRGVYSGAVGYFSLTGAADLSVVIRTAVLSPGTPGESGAPGIPATPGTPGAQAIPGEPGTPGTHAIPGTPGPPATPPTPARVRYGTGGAVVALSDPGAEFTETVVKAAPLLALTGGVFPGAGRAGAGHGPGAGARVIPRDTGGGRGANAAISGTTGR
ncbi:chorismate-binding protein [Streptantibioticus silvisoli]|uniref:aminodeoxychorismate synthase n=1 Tax=Streptantibioticus silvisoli TaxID=2705255 RepID=A0ABT6VU04_9ACTN|nr:chorismate-binding protein [Streptantibioticus silvisoli]